MAAKPKKTSKPLEAAPDVVPPVTPAQPQHGTWRCTVCGNEATGQACAVDGARSQNHE